jgi:hypothetical protein
MLSAGEVLALDERRLRIGLWPGTHTSKNLARSGPVVLCFVVPGIVLYVRGIARPLDPVPRAHLVRFEIEVTSVESDLHPGMPVTQAITFDVERNRDAVAADWEVQLRALQD